MTSRDVPGRALPAAACLAFWCVLRYLPLSRQPSAAWGVLLCPTVPGLQGRPGPLLPRCPAISHPLLGVLPFSCCPASPKGCSVLGARAPYPPRRGGCRERSRNGRGGAAGSWQEEG